MYIYIYLSIYYVYIYIYIYTNIHTYNRLSSTITNPFNHAFRRQGAVGVSKEGVQLKTKAYIAPRVTIQTLCAKKAPKTNEGFPLKW